MIGNPFMNHRILLSLSALFLLLAEPAWSKEPLSRHKADTTGSLFFNSFDGTRIHFESAGKGPEVVLLHGFIVDGSSWKRTPLYGALLKAGYRVLVPDLRGNGLSGKPHRLAAYEHDAEARDIMGLVRYLHFAHYVLVGYSRGSIICARILVLDPRVSRAVLGGMGSGFTNPDWPRRKMFYRALIGDSVPELAPMVRYIQSRHLDQKALALLQEAQPSTSPAELQHIRKPVLVICGLNDPDDGSPIELARMIPGSSLVRVPGNHDQVLQSPDFTHAVIRFLNQGRRP